MMNKINKNSISLIKNNNNKIADCTSNAIKIYHNEISNM